MILEVDVGADRLAMLLENVRQDRDILALSSLGRRRFDHDGHSPFKEKSRTMPTWGAAIKEALCPPNPNEFDMTAVISDATPTFGQ